VNLYAYAGNNPISYDDPFGLIADCRKVKCPSLLQVAVDKNVAAAGKKMLAASEGDGRERMAFLFNGPNNTITVGPVTVGYVGGMGDKTPAAPDNAIGSTHTHPDEDKGNPATGETPTPGGTPSGDDADYAAQNHIYGVVEAVPARYFLEWTQRGYHTVDRPKDEQAKLREKLQDRPQ
jgi:hypothetical protein